jgi:hypothetical protein
VSINEVKDRDIGGVCGTEFHEAGKEVSYAQMELILQSRRIKLILTTKSVLVNRINIYCINRRFNMLGYLVPS